MVERALSLALDPPRLMEAAGLPPDPWQADVLRSQAPQQLLLCTRQAGKSTTTAAKAVHEAVFRPGSLTLLLSPSLRQSSELFKKTKTYFDALARRGLPVPTVQESALKIELKTGSRIISLPGDEKTVRGFSGVDLLIIDEAARVLDDLYYSVRPMLAVSGGRILCLTTPWGKRGFFFTEWQDGGDAWKRTRVTAKVCPRISPEFLEAERRVMGERWFQQEYMCEFRDTIDTLFGYELIQNAFTSEIEPLVFD